jgi:hypothetical protein
VRMEEIITSEVQQHRQLELDEEREAPFRIMLVPLVGAVSVEI